MYVVSVRVILYCTTISTNVDLVVVGNDSSESLAMIDKLQLRRESNDYPKSVITCNNASVGWFTSQLMKECEL